MTTPKTKTASEIPATRAASLRQSVFDPLPNLTPTMLSGYHDRFRRGYLREAAYMWERIEEIDDKVKTVAPKRRKAVSRHGYEIIVNAGLEKDARALAHKETLEAFYDSLRVTSAFDLNERGGVSLLLRQMMSAVGMRYAVHEIVWRPSSTPSLTHSRTHALPHSGTPTLSAELRFVPLWLFENVTGRLRYLPTDYATSGVDLEEGGWLVTVGDGLMAATAVCYMYKRMPLRDWLIYCGRIGGVHGQTAASEDSEAWRAMEQAVTNIGLDTAIVTDLQSKVTPINVSASGELPYAPLVERMDRAIVSLWRGGDLSTMSGSGPDSTGASVQSDEQDVLEQDDAEMLTDTINEQLDRWVIRYQFGEEPLAWFKIKTAERKDVKQDILVDQALSQLGFPLTQESLANRYSRTLPEADETLLQPRSSAPILPNSQTPTPNSQANAATPALTDSHTLAAPEEQARQKIIAATTEQTLAARSAIYAEWLKQLDALAQQSDLSESQFLDAAQALVQSMPAELLTPENISALAKPLEAALGSATLNALIVATTPTDSRTHTLP